MSLRAQRGNLPEGQPHYKTHARYFRTCVEKKAHTSKKVSIIACNNVISKVQCATQLWRKPKYNFDGVKINGEANITVFVIATVSLDTAR